MKGLKMLLHPSLCVCVLALSSCYLTILSVAQITDPSEGQVCFSLNSPSVPTIELNALLAIKRGLIDPMNHLSSWNKGDPCTSNWSGVFCFHTLGTDEYLHTRELQLLNMNLSGNLAPELGQLSHLEILDFMWNELTGSIPKEIGNISSLRLLLLNGNKLSGSLPQELGYLVNLNRLQLDQNYISGPIPKSFANMSSVRHLHLNNNSINGQIPSELSKLSTLVHLLLDNNNLTGYLPPEFSNFPALRILQLDNNNFNGSEIPSTYRNFSRIVKLSLRNCSLRGTIPDFSTISNLLYLDLSKNNLAGPVPSKLSDKIITIYLSDNHLTRSIPESFSYLPFLQILSLENNLLTGSVPSNMWLNISFSTSTRLRIDLRNNLLSNIFGDLNPPVNVTLRLAGNPICSNANMQNVTQFCRSGPGVDILTERSTNPMMLCPIQACPTDDFFEYVPSSPVPCFCAAPLRIGYRLKSPSFSYFDPYAYSFEKYITNSLNLDLYQVSVDSFSWEKGPRLRMYLKLFPPFTNTHSSSFNQSEVYRIRAIFTSWKFPGDHLFGPYELLNFTLLGPYSGVDYQTRGIKINKGVWAAIVFGTIACALAFSAMVTLLIVRSQNRYKLSKRHSSTRLSIKIDGIKDFKFREMALATDGFNISTQVGQGGYGKVYRGTLADETVVAVKRAEKGSLQGQKEFLTEIEVLSRLHHRNLVSLVGYCDEEGEQILVYEFMPNGTLRDWLSAKAKGKLNFDLRLSIAMDSAKGILYLHNEAHPPVFHRDIKASNILLDSQLIAKVADFGLSRLAPVLDDEGNLPNHVSTVVKGTPGYLDPEYLLTHKLTDKSDVYGLGIVFLELLTGMKPISHGKNIVREVNMAHQSGMMFSIIDSRMGSYPSECVQRFVGLALQCCHDKPEKRPSMLDVVRELENIVSKMPETDGGSGISTSTTASTSSYSGRITTPTSNSGETASSSTPFYRSRDVNWMSGVSASDPVSGVASSITPR